MGKADKQNQEGAEYRKCPWQGVCWFLKFGVTMFIQGKKLDNAAACTAQPTWESTCEDWHPSIGQVYYSLLNFVSCLMTFCLYLSVLVSSQERKVICCYPEFSKHPGLHWTTYKCFYFPVSRLPWKLSASIFTCLQSIRTPLQLLW